ncbi:MAG: universal stress protein [Cyclobacteriaceae bacterium]
MKPIKQILAPTDFSDRATRALRYAISLAQTFEAKLFILHAYQTPDTAIGTPYPMANLYVDTLAVNKQVVQEVEESFEEIKMKHLVNKKVNYEFISSSAFPEEAIEEAIKEKEIDLVVMGNRGDSDWEKLLGSTTSHMMRRTSCPILAIPENAIYAKVDRILFATDYRQVDQAATFRVLLSLATMFQAQIDVLHITPFAEKLNHDQLAAGEAVERTFHAVRHFYHQQESEDVLDGIQAYLSQHDNIGLVAVMPRDHDLWERLTHSSVAKEIVFESDRPVLAFHP